MSPMSQAAYKGSIFGMRLEEMMRRQGTLAPSLEVPLPLVVLAHAILHQNGAQTEGVFRIPAPSSELQRLIKQFDSGNYIIDFTPADPSAVPPSVHCLAGALKKLLRESPDSLIPAQAYDHAIAIAQEAEPGNAAQNLVGTLPTINKRVMMFLIRFLQEFLHPDCVARSKMTLDNIAMVFAPTVLRSPSEDLNVMVANSLREKAFVRLLLETQPSFAWWALPGENPPPSLSSYLPNSPRLTLDVLQSMLDSSFLFSSAPSSSPSRAPLSPSTPPLPPTLSHLPTLSLSPSSLPLSTTLPASSLSLSSEIVSPLASTETEISNDDESSAAYRRRSHSLDFSIVPGDSSPIPIPSGRERSWTVADSFEEEFASTPPAAPSLSPYRASRPPPPRPPRRTLPSSAASTPPSASESEAAGSTASALEEEIARLKTIVAHEMSARVLAEEETKRLEAEAVAQREQIERLRDQLDAARADAFSTQAQAESARELSEEIRAQEANTLRELERAREEAARAREEAQRVLEEKNREVEEKRREVEAKNKEVEEKAKEVAAKTKEVEEKARLVNEKTKEAETARKEAEMARGEGERARAKAESEADRVKREMEKAKADAESARAELERARIEAEEAVRRRADAGARANAIAGEGEDDGELEADENDEKVLARVRAGPIPRIAEQRDAIAGELVFLATRIAYASDIGQLMELSKALRSIRHALEAVIQAAGMEEWQIAQLCRIYASSLSPLLLPLEDLPTGDPPGPPDPYTDLEKVRKMRTIALHAARACLDLLSALVAHTILSGRSSSVTKQTENQFNVIISKLLTPEQKLAYIKREARVLVGASEELIAQVKKAFPTTPSDRLADLARPIIALVKDLDTFFSWAGLEVPTMGSPQPDDRVTDDRLRRVRAMLFVSLNKVGAQATIMRNSLDSFDAADPRVLPMIERIHLIVEALQVSATPI